MVNFTKIAIKLPFFPRRRFQTYMRLLLTLLFLALLPAGLLAQQADTTTIVLGNPDKLNEEVVTISGKVVTAVTGDPAGNAAITIEGFANQIEADAYGNFRLFLPPGRYRLLLEHATLLPAAQNIAIYRSGSITIEMNLQTKEMEEVIVTAYASDTKVADVTAGVERMKIQDIEVQPAFMGEVDIVKSLQWLPGVSSAGEGSAGFNVRGGRIDQNLVLLEGAPIFNPTHFLGFFSSVQADVVESFSLYKGHVPGQYGGRAASVLDIQTRYGNPDSFRIKLGLGVVAAHLSAEGPIGKKGGSFIVGMRSSYSNWVLQQAENINVARSDAGFQDVFAGIRYPLSDKHILELFAYGSRDRFQYSDQFGFAYETGLAGLHWYYLAAEDFSLEVSAHASNYLSDFIDPSGFDAGRASTGIRYVHGRQQGLYTPGKHSIRFGMEQTLYQMRDATLSPEGAQSALLPEQAAGDQALELAFFVDDEWEINPMFSLAAGLRYVTYQQLGEAGVRIYDPAKPRIQTSIIDSISYGPGETVQQYGGFEPRAALRWRFNTNTSLKVSYNRLQQFIHLISNTAAPTPVDIWQLSNSYLQPQISDQFSLGIYRNFDTHRWETSIEGFYKDQSQLIEYQDFASLLVNPFLETELVNARGKAYGAEAIIRKRRGRLTGWLGYTYARSFIQTTSEFPEEQVNNGEWYPAPYDQPHQVDLISNISLGNGSSFGLNVNYRRGRPFTALETSYETEEAVIPLFSYRNQYRIPDYFRMDISLTLGSIVKSWDDQLVFSVYNLLGRENAFSIFYQRPDGVFIPKPYKLAVLGAAFPSLSYNVEF